MFPNQQDPFNQYPPQPQQPQQPYVPPVDYLNQIAPQVPKKPSMFTPGPKLVALIGGAAIVLVLILVMVVNLVTGGQKANAQTLSARLVGTQTIAEGAQANIKSSRLQNLNSSLRLTLTNTNRDIAEPMAAIGVNTAELNEAVLLREAGTEVIARLDEARLMATFDRDYAREMTFQLATTLTLMQELYNSTSRASLKEYLETSYNNLEPIYEGFQNYSTIE